MAIKFLDKRPRSLALRVTVLVGVVTTMLFLIFVWSVERSIETHFARMDLESMQLTLHTIDSVLQQAGSQPTTSALKLQFEDRLSGDGAVAVLIDDANGTVLFSSMPPQLSASLIRIRPGDTPRLDTLRTVTTPTGSWRVSVVQARGDRVALAMNIDFHLQYLNRLQSTLWAGTLLASVLTVLVAGLAVQQGHAPLRRISAKMRELSAERLSTRLDPNRVPIELKELVAAFNALLDRIEVSFDRLRDVTADIAHELRTPITNLTTQTQVALTQARDTDAYREVLYSNLEEFERLSVMIADMLFLAQTDQGRANLHRTQVDLGSEVQDLVEYFEALAEERGIDLRMEGTVPIIQGDKAMLRRALSNLVSNAIRYTPIGRSIEVRLSADVQCVRVDVRNEGVTIAPKHLKHIFERFYRIEPSRQRSGEGAGLGLAIVKSIIEMHGGHVAAHSSNNVTEFSVQIPVTPQVV